MKSLSMAYIFRIFVYVKTKLGLKSFKLIQKTVLHDCQVSWFEALSECRRKGLRLASIETKEQKQDVVNLLKSEGTFIYNCTVQVCPI